MRVMRFVIVCSRYINRVLFCVSNFSKNILYPRALLLYFYRVCANCTDQSFRESQSKIPYYFLVIGTDLFKYKPKYSKKPQGQ